MERKTEEDEVLRTWTTGRKYTKVEGCYEKDMKGTGVKIDEAQYCNLESENLMRLPPHREKAKGQEVGGYIFD